MEYRNACHGDPVANAGHDGVAIVLPARVVNTTTTQSSAV